MFEITVEGHFSAAHHLLNYDGECENQHGHNWKVEVSVKGNKLNSSNILIDFKVLKNVLNEILDKLDHKDLNEIEDFKGQSPSSEIIAQFIFNEIKKKIDKVSVVSVWETDRAKASYFE